MRKTNKQTNEKKSKLAHFPPLKKTFSIDFIDRSITRMKVLEREGGEKEKEKGRAGKTVREDNEK